MKLAKQFRYKYLLIVAICALTSIFLTTTILFDYLTYRCELSSSSPQDPLGPQSSFEGRYDRNSSLIFVGGWPRSGTTLMRAILDAHPDVRCGEETHIIPPFLEITSKFWNITYNRMRLLEAGISNDVFFSASASFLLEIIVRHGEPAPRLCNKDPFTAKYSEYLSLIFPSARFVLMLRDGRAACYSTVSRSIGIGGIDLNNITACLVKWNEHIDGMYSSCLRLGDEKCLLVKYEQLVLHPKSVLEKVLQFLNVPWNEAVLHHDELVNKPGGISLSRMEPSTDQIIKPVNIESLTKWAEFIPEDIRLNIRHLAPMLEKLGYDPDAYPPDYGKPDKEVLENNQTIQDKEEFFKFMAWQVRNQSKILTSEVSKE